uniref:Uncharacterized protein n=1 Tax=Panagrolaimus superbus TaxID=310955 RepID=A0A914Z3B2_9BILA
MKVTYSTPERMQFKASTKLLNPNIKNIDEPVRDKPKEPKVLQILYGKLFTNGGGQVLNLNAKRKAAWEEMYETMEDKGYTLKKMDSFKRQ